jgi:YaiO family outer membrane protein
MNFSTRAIAAIFAACTSWCAAAADLTGNIEAGLSRHSLSAGLGKWNDQYVRANLITGPGSWWTGEVAHSSHFGDDGTLFVLGHSRNLNENWYGSASVAGSSGGFFLPSLRMDLTANRKWGARQNLISTFGLTTFNAKDGHRDRSVLLALTYYTDWPLIVEGGVRINNSNPGSVNSRANYVAATYGRDKEHMISLRHGFGEEAYQIIGDNAVLVGLHSKVDTLTWRQWLRPRQGFQMRAEIYTTPFYRRKGVEVALFQEF